MSSEALTPPDTLRVAVRVLCAFTAQAGDLDLRFTPSPTAQDGVAGHEAVTARRPAPYQREVPLRSRCGDLLVQGRADGFDPTGPRLEEIKTHRGDVALVRDNHRALHWAQARVYAWMLCEHLALERIEVALVYFNIDTHTDTALTAWHTADELRQHFHDLCARYIRWARGEQTHRLARDAQLQTLSFPFDGFRAGQRDLAGATYRTHSHGRHLLVQAPTGIGKTMATLFGALRAMPAQGTDKLLYLTAKTPGRQLALDALRRLQPDAPAGRLRVLERVAREKACEHPDKACHGDACPLAKGFYDRLPQARDEAAQAAWLDQAGLRSVALTHNICPYYLGQDMLRWSDVVVGDFNHFFDLSAHAWALTVGEPWRVGLLLDEAHNLVERARQMYSAELDPSMLAALRKAPPAGLKASLDRLHRFWGTLGRAQVVEQALLSELPDGLVGALQQHTADLSGHLALDATAPDVRVQAWLFEVLHFLRVAEVFGDHSLVEITHAGAAVRGRSPRPRLAIRNLVPAPHLQARWLAAHSATLFSATLSPMDHAIDLLGLPADCARLEVPSPFDPAQLTVHVTPHISTRFNDRAASLDDVVAVMAAQYRALPGNYLAFFSSFDYLQQALARFGAAHPDIAAWSQSRGMAELDRNAFVARFTEHSQGIGFAVLGGAFGEGIDLPGQRLIGAFIATLGLPQVNPLNEQLRARLQARFGRGYDYAYLVPGLQKVVQAAGRVIRGPDDRGVVVLMDDRFARPEVRGLLPPWWRVGRG
ncbi:ATP-dependent DNA helicase [Hydrogenophaga sp. Root209]|uniref:helicase C-terminal domain-containing protein n=1 Tax=Hydrogenophaga sp. Root209 TaxID=1736490 RepID=UPI0006F502E1|nr:helicase C-terminal domain-containing protein [Hydrogenophaga sp. Root209]KRC00498.1 ATP-dependent DNA helicase [Hydrogenophaga sp. Root209]